jgi:CBS domain-containing protein
MSTLNDANLIVSDVMLSLNVCPVVSETTMFKEVLESMDEHRLGVVCVTAANGELAGILTEGDIRRVLLRVQKPLAALMADDVGAYAIRVPKTTHIEMPLTEAVSLMGRQRVWDLPVVDRENKLVGLLHLHQAILEVLANKNGQC